ncbi:hypothetical protein [Martelella radicis]|uniref:Uncharacterized protein n=1 Tax=Martelella radicis TaxID=1397476 RepID=A0A7W6KNX3_9HYPH|nr:hypothetical protein [Martelella radicis]MBB4124635.1 hypothetical protein [Martelella radicis]
MATRDKTEEKARYGCTGEPMPAIGLGNIKSDNGTGLRNAEVVEAIVGLGAQSTIARTYASTDKPFVERMFGTLEETVLRTLHGYTGRKAGELPGYDATANGVLDVEQLYGILTRYFIDEYPSTCHYGIGMWGQRPIEVFKKLNRERGCFPPIDPNLRRIRLCWEDKVTPTDEGVRVFTGIWFNSAELQRLREEHRIQGKVSVFIDPDNLAHATVVLPKVETVVEVQLQMTYFKSMTLAQFLAYVARVRKESPAATEIHEQRIMQVRRERHDLMQAIGVEKGLPRSYMTAEEAKKKANVVLAGTKLIPSAAHGAFDIGASPDAITDLSTDSSPQTYKVAGADLVMDATIAPEDTARKQRASAHGHVKEPTKAKAPELKPEASQRKKPNKQNSGHLGRPLQIKDLE